MSTQKIKALGKQPLNIMVYESIKNAILDGIFEPGTRLTETSLSKQLNVSSTPVREAFRRLESERFVEIIPYRGAIVQKFSLKEIDDVYKCRLPLEILAIELAIDNITDDIVDKLYFLVEKSRKTNDISEYVRINSEIHNLILECANNQTLKKLLDQINDVIDRDRNISSNSLKRKTEINKEHLKIVDAIKSRNKESAKKAMEIHINNGYAYINRNLQSRDKTD